MSARFARARPIQAGKLVAIVVALPIGGAVFFGLVPYPGVLGLFLVPLLGVGLTVVVVLEALSAGFRALRAGRPTAGWLGDRPVYTVVRAGEVVAAVAWVAALLYVLSTIPDGPMAGPGAIGLWLIMVGLALVVVVASLVRTLVEYYYHRVGVAG